MFSIKTNIPRIKDKFKRLQLLTASGAWQDQIVDVMEKARAHVAMLTPESSGEGSKKGTKKKQIGYRGHLADGWKLRVIGKGGKDRVPVLGVVYNAKTHKPDGSQKKNAQLKQEFSGGRGGGKKVRIGKYGPYTVLEILEYGSRAHKIYPFNKRALKFETGGEVVFTKSVDHPGTKPYGMVRTTREKLRRWLREVNVFWAKKLAKEWSK